MGAAAAGQVAPTARNFAARWSVPRLVAGRSSGATSPPVKPGQKVSKKRAPAPLQALGFTLDELREARLAPIVDFKGRGKPGAGRCLSRRLKIWMGLPPRWPRIFSD
jgi:ribosome maturation factor RimP